MSEKIFKIIDKITYWIPIILFYALLIFFLIKIFIHLLNLIYLYGTNI